MKKSKLQTIFLNLLLVMGVFGLVLYLLRSSMEEIVKELKETPMPLVLGVTCLGIIYQVIEGYNVKTLGKGKKIALTSFEGMVASCYTAFMRVITFGAGTVLSEIWYYNQKKIKTPYSVGLTLSRMIFYKIALFLIGIFGLFVIGGAIYEKDSYLFFLAIFGLFGTFIVVTGLLSLACSLYLQVKLVQLANYFFKNQKWREKFDNLNLQIYALRSFFFSLIKNKTLFLKVLFLNLCKVSFWLVIPSIAISRSLSLNEFVLYFFLTDFAMLTAGILPAPAGMGSLEFIFLLFFPLFLTKGQSVSALLLFRFASYFLPFVMGMIFSFKMREEKIKEELNDI